MRRLVREMQGVGDLVEAAAKLTGIKAATQAISKATGRDCGCAKRRDKLNQLMPFREAADGVQRNED
jgi:hypothetical protein